MQHQIGEIIGKRYGMLLAVAGEVAGKNGVIIKTSLLTNNGICVAPNCKEKRAPNVSYCFVHSFIALVSGEKDDELYGDKLSNN